MSDLVGSPEDCFSCIVTHIFSAHVSFLDTFYVHSQGQDYRLGFTTDSVKTDQTAMV